METNRQENIIKDLLYEHTSRELLISLKRKKQIKIYTLFAAAAVIIICAMIGINLFNDGTTNRNLLVASQYEFPLVAKSRSEQTSIVDDYLTELNQKQYSLVLEKLYTDQLSEKDLFVKSNLYFVLDSIDQAKDVIEKTKWQDNYHSEEVKWLLFLIEVKKGSPKATIEILLKDLPEEYHIKARDIIDKLN